MAKSPDPWQLDRVRLKSGLGVRFARAGNGPLVVMLHGFPECWYSWRFQLRDLSDRFCCVAPDLRGYGGTDAPRGVQNYRIELLVGDVLELIASLGRDRAVVVGHDWGGAIAWVTALLHPEAVESLVVLNCPHPRQFKSHLRHNPRQILRSWYILFFQLPLLPEIVLGMRARALLLHAMRNSAVHKEAFGKDDLAVYRSALAGPYRLTAALNYYRALRRQAVAPAHWIARKISVPTMLIWGEQDVALGKELTYGMENLFSNRFELHYIPDSGHWVQQERPELVTRLIADFLSGNIKPNQSPFA